MNPKIGMHLPNGASDITDALSFGFGSYLVIAGDHAFDQVAAIQRAQPDARIYLRRYGGIGGSPQDVAYEMAALFNQYRPWGVEDLIGWNEPDRAEEGGFNVAYIRDFALAYLTIMREICPDARLHWPAIAHLERYQDPEQWIWLPAAQQFDVFDCHAYNDPANAAAFFRWCETRLPGKPVVLTEFNYGPGNARPDDYGAWLYEVYRLAAEAPNVEAVTPFIWEWIHPEAGIGTSLDIRRDPDALAGIRRAVMDFHVEPPPEPEPPTPEPEPETKMIQTAIYLHQFDRNYREKSYAEFARTAKEYGIDQVWFKAWQGGSLAVWDKSALGLSTYDRIARCFDECAAEGVEAVMWGVPQGGTWRADAAICKAIGARCGGKAHIDLENFKGFWDAPAYGVTGQPPFFQMLKDADLIVDVSAVGRFGEPELTPWEEIVDLIDSVWLQSYWTDFGALAFAGGGPLSADSDVLPVYARPELAHAILEHFKDQPRALSAPGPLGITATGVVTDDINALLRVGVPIEKIGSIFPHNGSRQQMDDAREAIQTLNVGRVSIWVWDYAGLTPFEFLRDVKAAEPAPVDKDALWTQAAHIGQEVRDSADTAIWVATPGNTEVSEQTALDELYRIGGIWQDAASTLRDVALRLKG